MTDFTCNGSIFSVELATQQKWYLEYIQYTDSVGKLLLCVDLLQVVNR